MGQRPNPAHKPSGGRAKKKREELPELDDDLIPAPGDRKPGAGSESPDEDFFDLEPPDT
jgi:hypothetical protein